MRPWLPLVAVGLLGGLLAGCAQSPAPAPAAGSPQAAAALHRAYHSTLDTGTASVRLTETVQHSGQQPGTITGAGHVDFHSESSDLVFATQQFAGVEVLRLGSTRYQRRVRPGQPATAGWAVLPASTSPAPSSAAPTSALPPAATSAAAGDLVTDMLGYLDDGPGGVRDLGAAGGVHRYQVDLDDQGGRISIQLSVNSAGRLSREQLQATGAPPGTTMNLDLALSDLGRPVSFPRPAD
jgi:hypothetical protein